MILNHDNINSIIFGAFPLFRTIARNEAWDIKISVNQKPPSCPAEIPDSAIVALRARFGVWDTWCDRYDLDSIVARSKREVSIETEARNIHEISFSYVTLFPCYIFMNFSNKELCKCAKELRKGVINKKVLNLICRFIRNRLRENRSGIICYFFRNKFVKKRKRFHAKGRNVSTYPNIYGLCML